MDLHVSLIDVTAVDAFLDWRESDDRAFQRTFLDPSAHRREREGSKREGNDAQKIKKGRLSIAAEQLHAKNTAEEKDLLRGL